MRSRRSRTSCPTSAFTPRRTYETVGVHLAPAQRQRQQTRPDHLTRECRESREPDDDVHEWRSAAQRAAGNGGLRRVGRGCHNDDGVASATRLHQYSLKARMESSRKYFEAIEAKAAGRNDSPPARKRTSIRRPEGPQR